MWDRPHMSDILVIKFVALSHIRSPLFWIDFLAQAQTWKYLRWWVSYLHWWSDISAFGLLRCWWVLQTGRNMPRGRKGQSGSASATCQSTPTRVCTSSGWYRPRGCQCHKAVTTLRGFFNPKMWWLCTSAMQTTSVDGCSGMDKLDRTSKAQGQSVR